MMISVSDDAGRVLALRRYGLLDSQPDPQFDMITSLVRDLLDVPICAVSLIDEREQWCRSVQGNEPGRIPRAIAFCDHAIREKTPFIVTDAARDARFAGNPLVTEEPHMRSYAGAPLTSAEGYNLGALCVIDREPRDFSASQLSVLERFARLVMEQLELRTLAQRDGLTNVLTRRAFEDAATTILHRASDTGEVSTLVLLDVDHFKAINDTYGHPVGDQVLRQLCRTVEALLSPGDLLGRMGGEEFVLLLAGQDETALESAERIRRRIAEHVPAGCPPISASFGLASISAAADLAEAIAEADIALYAAKRGGRNRCVHAADCPRESAAA